LTAVYLEIGKKRVFASAIEWPGWCRAGRNEAAALDMLEASAPRYARVVHRAGLAFKAADHVDFDVVERLPGSATTDFGAPDAAPTCDSQPLDARGVERYVSLLRAGWKIFDDVVDGAPLELRKGPRGGGRNRDRIVDHVVNAEVMYARKLGLRLPAPKPTDRSAVADFRAAETEFFSRVLDSDPASLATSWLPRYAVRRIAWHVLDHAWEIEDKLPD
jgi:hypothetical protein